MTFQRRTELMPDELAALIEYAAKNGRAWKERLSLDWYHGRTVGPLQSIRNEFGPLWLARWRLPKPAPHWNGAGMD